MKKFKLFFALFAMLTLGVTNAWAQTVTWEKATSIAAGDVVALVCESKKMELSSISTTSTKYGIGTAYTSTPAGLYELTVEEGSSTGTFSFKKGTTYLYWTSGNSLATNATKSANTSWAVTFSNGNATILNAKDNSRKLVWNASSPRFACYTSAQTAVQLYKKVISEESGDVIVKTLKSIAVEGMTTTYEQGDRFKFDGTCTATYSVTKNDEPQADETKTVTPTVSTPNMEQMGTQTIEVSYKEGEVSVSTTYDITITENIITPGTYTGNLNNTFFNCTAGNQSEEQSGKFNDILVVAGCKANAQNKTYYDAAHVRFYTDSYLTLSVPTGYVIKSIVFTAGGDWKGSITASTGTYNNDTKSWSGYEQEVQFSFGQQNRIASISVTYEVMDLTHVAVPTISGTEDFSESATVTIAAEDGLKVYYTLDGTDPTNASTEYTAPFELTATTTVKAIAYNGENASDIASKTFTKCQVLTCQEAKDLCTSTQSTDKYAIRGYVTSIPYAYSSSYNNISFWMADTKDGGEVFEGYKAVPADNAAKSVKVGDYVELIGHIVLYNSTPETTQGGTYTVIPAPIIYHTVSVTAENGTVEGLAEEGKYEHGTEATLTATAAEGYEFTCWTVGEDTVSTANPYKFTVTADLALVANFKVAVTTITETFDLTQEEDTRNMGGTYSIYAGDYTLRIFGYEGAGTYQDDTTTVEDAAPMLFTPDYDDALNPVVVVTIDEENNKEVMQVTAASADGTKIYNLTINIALPSYEKYSLIATGIKAENETVEGISVIKLKGEGYLNGEEAIPFEFMVYESMMGYGAEGTIGEINVFSTKAEFFAEEGEFLLMATMQDEEGKYLFNVEVMGTMPKAEVEIVVKETKDVTLYNLNLDVQGNMAMVTADNMTLSFNLTLLDTENYYGTYTNDAFSNIWYGDDQLYAAYGEAQVYAEVDGKAKFVVSFISTPDAEGNVTLYNFTLYAGEQPAEPTKHTVKILVSSEGAGTVTGAGEYEDGAEVTVTATANKGWIFYGWLDEDGECLSNDDNYTFQVLDDVTLVACFFPMLEGTSTDCVISGNKLTATAQLSVGLLKMNLVLGEEKEEDVFVLTEESKLTIGDEEVILEDGRFMAYSEALAIAAFIAVYKEVPHYITVMILNPTTGVDNINTTVVPVKMIENGQLIIMKGDAKYNVQGAIIK